VGIRPIHLLGSPVLRERAQEVGQKDDDTRALIKDLVDTMHADKGIGLAANQIGVTKRVAIVEVGEEPPVVLIDPVIVNGSGKIRGEEGCLSIPDIFADVDRAASIVVETTTVDGTRTQIEATELLSRAIQHEIDHLDGILFLDRLSPLKRRLLLRKWQKLRKGETGHLKHVTPAAVEE